MDLVKLINKEYEAYCQVNSSVSFGKFVEWLYENRHSFGENEKEDLLNRSIGDLIVRLSRYSKNFTKTLFNGLEISTIEEFLVLNVLRLSSNITKSELFEVLKLEYTTGIQMTKRLMSLELILEGNNPLDKRAKNLIITEKGLLIFGKAFDLLGKECNLKFEVLTEHEKKQLQTLLTKVEKYQTNNYNAIISNLAE